MERFGGSENPIDLEEVSDVEFCFDKTPKKHYAIFDKNQKPNVISSPKHVKPSVQIKFNSRVNGNDGSKKGLFPLFDKTNFMRDVPQQVEEIQKSENSRKCEKEVKKSKFVISSKFDRNQLKEANQKKLQEQVDRHREEDDVGSKLSEPINLEDSKECQNHKGEDAEMGKVGNNIENVEDLIAKMYGGTPQKDEVTHDSPKSADPPQPKTKPKKRVLPDSLKQSLTEPQNTIIKLKQQTQTHQNTSYKSLPYIKVNWRQQSNPCLEHAKHWFYYPSLPPNTPSPSEPSFISQPPETLEVLKDKFVSDFQIYEDVHVLFLTLSYHIKFPDYINDRLFELYLHERELKERLPDKHQPFNKFLLLVNDIEGDNEDIMTTLNIIAVKMRTTLIQCWSYQEAGCYLNKLKSLYSMGMSNLEQRKPPHVEHEIRVEEVINKIPSITKTNVQSLIESYTSLSEIILTDLDQLKELGGFGKKRIEVLRQCFEGSFEEGEIGEDAEMD